MRRALFLISLCLAAGCSKEKTSVSMAIYQEPSGLFSCAGPADWRVLEAQGGAQRVSFFGPPAGQPNPYSVSIAIYYYPKSAYASPEDYTKAHAASGRRESLRRQKRREETVIIPLKEGFLAAIYTGPEASAEETLPLFRQTVASLSIQD